MNIEENEGEANGESYPEDNQTNDESYKSRHRSKVSESFGSQEAGECILFHRSEAVFLLSVEHIRYLRHDADFIGRLGLLRAVERESVDTQRRREVYLVVLVGAYGIPNGR